MDRDEQAMKRRDVARASGAVICDQCGGNGTVWQLVDGRPEDVPCPRCDGETWIDKNGKPFKIDPPQIAWYKENVTVEEMLNHLAPKAKR